MSSSEPRLQRTPTVGNAHELTSGDVNPLKSTVPHSTHIVVAGSMLLFFLAATLITLQAGWQWWLIPAVVLIPVAAVLIERIGRVRKAKEAERALQAELRSRVAGPNE